MTRPLIYPRPASRRFHRYSHLLLAVVCLLPLGTQALPGDQDQPIHITADKALRDEVKGFTIYSGNVHLVQGSMELDADKLTIHHNVDVADEIIAEGNPAKMRQQPELDEGIVHAHARVITYFKNEDRVHLQTEARIEQEGSVVEGDSIDYFIERQVITAESDQTREDNKVVVVIPPSMQKQSEEDASAESVAPAAPDNAEEESVAPAAPNDAEEGSVAPAVPDDAEEDSVAPVVPDDAEEGVSGTTESE